MKKNIIIAMFLLFALSFSVFADTISLDPANINIGNKDIGDVVTGTFTVNNTGTSAISQLAFNLNNNKLVGSEDEMPLSVSFTPPQLTNLAVGVPTEVNYTFTVPEVLAGAYTGDFNIINASSTIDTLSINMNVNENHNLSTSVNSQSAVAGTTKTFNMTFENLGNTHLNIITMTSTALTKTGDSFTGITVDEDNIVSLDYEGTKQVPVSVVIPSGKSGVYTANITATYNGVQTAVAELTLDIDEEDLETTITTQNIIWVEGQSTSEDIDFVVENTGNTDLTNVQCEITGFEDSEGETAISTAYFSSTNTVISSLAVDADTEKSFTLQNIPSSLELGTYTATLSCSNAIENKTVTLTYRNPTTSLDVDETISFGTSASPISRNTTATKVFNITNDGDVLVNDIELSISNAKQGVVFTATNDTTYDIGDLDAGETKEVTLEVFVDYDLDGGRNELGRLQVQSADITTITSDIYLYVKTMLDIEDATIEIDNDDDKSIMPDSDRTVSVKPGSSIDIEIDVKSLYDDNDEYEEEIEIDEVQLTAIIDDLDIDETSDSETLSADDSETISVSFDLPYDLEDEEYILELEVTGDDDEGAEYSIEWSVTLEVDRETRELIILEDQTGFVDAEVECDDVAYINAEIMNIGKKELKDVVLEIKNTELGFTYKETIDELSTDYDDTDSRLEVNEIPIDLGELGAEAKTYKFIVRAYYDTIQQKDTYNLNLKCVEASSSSSDDDSDDDDDTDDSIISIGGGTQAGTDSDSSDSDTSQESNSMFNDFKGSTGYIVLLVIGMAAVIGLFVWAVAKL